MKKVTAASGDYLVSFHPLTIVSNVSMRNGTYPLMFIGWIYNKKPEKLFILSKEFGNFNLSEMNAKTKIENMQF